MAAALDCGSYPAGVQVSDAQMKDLEDRALTRHAFHGEWNYAVAAVPRPAPPPPPAPPRPGTPGLCDPALLDHPALTGLDPAGLAALAAALELPARGYREQRRYARSGRPRARPGRAGGWNRKLDLTGHVIATRLRARLHLPVHVIAALLGTDKTTISHATSRTAALLAQLPPATGHPAAAPAPAIRLRTLDDMRQYAARHGITIPAPAAHSTARPDDTPQTHLNLE